MKNRIAENPVIFMFNLMWRFSEGNRRNVVLFIILVVVANLIALTNPLIFAWFLNEIQINGVSYENIAKLSGIISLPMLTTLLFWTFRGSARVLEQQNSLLSEINYRRHFLQGALNLNMQWHGDHDSGETIDQINKATRSLYNYSRQISNLLKISIGILGAVFAISFFNVYIALGVFIAIVSALFVLSRFDIVLIRQFKVLKRMENKISAGIFDTISNITTVLVLNIQNIVTKRLSKLLCTPIQKEYEHSKLNQIKWFVGSLMFSLITVLPLVLYLLSELNAGRVIAIGTISALYLYLGRMSNSFFSFGNIYENILYWRASIANAEKIEKIISSTNNDGKYTSIDEWNTLKIRGLNFSYASPVRKRRLHLDCINITIKKGERIAFIGESGSGKTTFLKVLHGLYASATATISFSSSGGTEKSFLNANFSKIDMKTMLVPQEPEIFSSTIKENITLGLPVSDEEIEMVLQLSRFKDVILKLPRGLISKVNEKGVNLSGGQKQRLALARALLYARDKEIILLDESTSSVDPENEAKIYENIFSEFKEKTILASIHKMNLLKYFDRIVIFDNGKVADNGTFKELLERNTKFKKDWKEFVE